MRLTGFNGKPISSLLTLSRRLWHIKTGDTVTVTLYKRGQIKLTAEKNIPEDGLHMAESRLGLKLYPLTASIAKALHYPLQGGLVISDYLRNTALEPPRRGDILYQLGDVMIKSPQDIVSALRNSHYDDHIKAAVISILKKNGRYYLLKKNLTFTVH
jgi:S1-C subfamily serine protease